MRFNFKTILFSIAILIVFSGALLAAWLKGLWIPNQPALVDYPVRGIDVSHHNGMLNWTEIAANQGIRFAYIKATEGADWTDAKFASNWQAAKANNVRRGAYHFFSTQSRGEDQANHFIRTVPVDSESLPPVVDVEFAVDRSRMSETEFFQELDQLIQRLSEHYGKTPIIYTTPEFYRNYFQNHPISQPLWAREVIGKPGGWSKDWLFWQYSGRGRIAGANGRTDLNVFRGSLEELEKL